MHFCLDLQAKNFKEKFCLFIKNQQRIKVHNLECVNAHVKEKLIVLKLQVKLPFFVCEFKWSIHMFCVGQFEIKIG